MAVVRIPSQTVTVAAGDVGYTPDNGANWPDPDPTTIEEGLDDAASRLTTLEGASVGASNTGSFFFNGSSSYLEISNAASPNLSLTSDFTLEAWIYIGTAVGDRAIMTRWGATDASKNYLFRYDGTSTLEMFLWDSAGPFQITYNSTGVRLETNSWNHVAVTFNATTDTAAFYVNGISAGTDTSAITTIQAGTAAFRIGSMENAMEFFTGFINTARVWSDVRTQQEINEGMYTIYGEATPGLISEWSLNGDSTDAISGYDLTPTDTYAGAFVPWRI